MFELSIMIVVLVPGPMYPFNDRWGRAISHEGDDSAEKSRGYGQDQGQGQGENVKIGARVMQGSEGGALR